MLQYQKHSGITTTTILFLSFCLGIVNSGYSQNADGIISTEREKSERIQTMKNEKARYSISMKSISIEKALEVVANEAGLRLAYCSDFFKNGKAVNVSSSKMTFEEIMREILSDTDLDYEITDTDHLVIFKKGQKETKTESSATLKGEVLNGNTAAPLYDAIVYLQKKGAQDVVPGQNFVKKTFVDSEGRYDIHDIDPGTYRLVIVFRDQSKVFENIRVRKTTVANFNIGT